MDGLETLAVHQERLTPLKTKSSGMGLLTNLESQLLKILNLQLLILT